MFDAQVMLYLMYENLSMIFITEYLPPEIPNIPRVAISEVPMSSFRTRHLDRVPRGNLTPIHITIRIYKAHSNQLSSAQHQWSWLHEAHYDLRQARLGRGWRLRSRMLEA